MLKKRFFKTKDEVEVTFEVEQEHWESAQVAGDFNNWQPEPMTLVKKSGQFKFKTRLPKEQKIEFRYLFNEDKWENDPQADGYVANGFGSDNSLVLTSE
ncbi:1,4-alpha-glucan branching protein [Vibrio navarrensis]|uniref:Isoamylase early set domain-containing protein n=1 Tax=Vibrio navarrensis TaxID=29495 RepID=A0AAI9CXR8_9VIBR|nr:MULTISPECIES: isoamylase early set domain-containing protein [Vibrio]EHA1123514.1 1,4-alpha-glucan branching protein [Vibrio navarrensis]EJL6400182.1 isoamylase early set domain-containing protein [Vibrio navarrensis]EJL6565962.1 isoamylase early set domain-containing protein [Vibrio navarrensis]ELN6934156.1 isoamylase early set domain-containing protein [Vibrio navarrensis]KGK20898.1 1,4-alpha-glucan branching protein [Vibrio navarrensis]